MTVTAAIVAVAFSILIAVLGVAVQWGVNNRRWAETDKTEATFRGHHKQHFDEVKALQKDAGRAEQRLLDHITLDDRRFEQTDQMLQEIRGDIKELIKRGNSE